MTQIHNSKRKLTKIYTETLLKTKSTKMENKIKKKIIKKKIKIYKSLQLSRRLGVAETAHSALDAFIYRFSNVRPHFNNYIVDPQNYGPNWSLCPDIKSYVATEFSVFIVGLCSSM